jgi:hypothetical protein
MTGSETENRNHAVSLQDSDKSPPEESPSSTERKRAGYGNRSRAPPMRTTVSRAREELGVEPFR